jgi:hypothetical protein
MVQREWSDRGNKLGPRADAVHPGPTARRIPLRGTDQEQPGGRLCREGELTEGRRPANVAVGGPEAQEQRHLKSISARGLARRHAAGAIGMRFALALTELLRL